MPYQSNLIPTSSSDIHDIVDEIFGADNTVDDIIATLRYHFGDHPDLSYALEDLDEFLIVNPFPDEEELQQIVLDLLQKYLDE